ncbi:MAG TPA: YegS/Rv2252/BmrU family lipid kinase [Burkholderiales bacterium]
MAQTPSREPEGAGGAADSTGAAFTTRVSAALVVNTRSRRGRRLYARALELLQRGGVRLDHRHPLRDPRRLRESVRAAIAQGAQLVILGGGDGSVSAVVNELAHRDVVLGVLPLGTANSFARTLGIPLAIEGAVETILRGRVANIDLGRIGDHYFANTTALGLSSAIAHSRLAALKRWLGPPSYALAGAAKLYAHRPFRCTLIEDGRCTALEALDVLIANGRYQGGALAAPEASVESRELVIRVIKGPSRLNMLRAWMLTALRRAPGPALMERIRAADLRIETTPPQHVSIDGEVVGRTPIRASVAPDALKVIVGPDYPERRPAGAGG